VAKQSLLQSFVVPMQYRCLISLFIAHRKATTYSFSKVMPKVHFAKKYFHDLFTGNDRQYTWTGEQ